MSCLLGTATSLPSWVPQAVRHYLAHTEASMPIRELARLSDLHPSTVMRQVRKFESRRDDPLVDSGLRRLADSCSKRQLTSLHGQAALAFVGRSDLGGTRQDDVASEAMDLEVMRVLRRLAEVGAVMAMARDMDNGVVVRDDPDGSPQRLAVVGRETAEAMVLQDWIACRDVEARINRYYITAAGRAELKLRIAQDENRAGGFADARTAFDHSSSANAPKHRHVLIDSPISGLSRRRDRDGKPFLSRELVAAGERLREDFELSQMQEGPEVSWADVLADGFKPLQSNNHCDAYNRVAAALADLGPGLGDVALRACCYLEGMESLEKRMGWSARSGKIVLRIALQRLRLHYAGINGGLGEMIG